MRAVAVGEPKSSGGRLRAEGTHADVVATASYRATTRRHQRRVRSNGKCSPQARASAGFEGQQADAGDRRHVLVTPEGGGTLRWAHRRKIQLALRTHSTGIARHDRRTGGNLSGSAPRTAAMATGTRRPVSFNTDRSPLRHTDAPTLNIRGDKRLHVALDRSLMMKRLRTLAILVIMVLPPVFSSGRLAANDAPTIAGTEQVHLLVGRSAVIRTDRAITRVALSTPEIADAMVTSPRELIVHGKTPGTISLLVWERTPGASRNYEVTVRRDLTAGRSDRRQFPPSPSPSARNGKGRGAVGSRFNQVRDRFRARCH